MQYEKLFWKDTTSFNRRAHLLQTEGSRIDSDLARIPFTLLHILMPWSAKNVAW